MQASWFFNKTAAYNASRANTALVSYLRRRKLHGRGLFHVLHVHMKHGKYNVFIFLIIEIAKFSPVLRHPVADWEPHQTPSCRASSRRWAASEARAENFPVSVSGCKTIRGRRR